MHGTRNAPSQLVFFSLRNGVIAAVRPGVHVRAVVGRVEDDGVVGDAEVVERLEELADVPVVLDHAVGVLGPGGQARRVAALGLHVGAAVHPGAVAPAEERLAGLRLPLDVVDGRVRRLVVDRLHPLLGQRAGVLDGLLADPAPARLLGRVVLVRRLAPQHAARAEHLPELAGPAGSSLLRLLLGVEVVEVAEELVEPVDRRQVLVQVAEVVLAELAGGVAVVLEQLGDGRVARPAARPARPARRPWRARCGTCTGR